MVRLITMYSYCLQTGYACRQAKKLNLQPVDRHLTVGSLSLKHHKCRLFLKCLWFFTKIISASASNTSKIQKNS